MLFAVAYFCDHCGYRCVERYFKEKVPTYSAAPQYIECPGCTKQTEKCFGTGGGQFIIKEGNDPISSKPDSYWENAEFIAQKQRKKRYADAKETALYSRNKGEKKDYVEEMVARRKENNDD